MLRTWESRYGFPAPLRDAHGERVYPADQGSRLRLIRRLRDAGLRPSSIVRQDEAGLAELARRRQVPTGPQESVGEASAALEVLRLGDPDRLRRHLQRRLLQDGLSRFVPDMAAPLNHAVGAALAQGADVLGLSFSAAYPARRVRHDGSCRRSTLRSPAASSPRGSPWPPSRSRSGTARA